jgi:hypothetical protein
LGAFNNPATVTRRLQFRNPLAFAPVAVKVKTNFFLIGLSSVESDRVRNTQLLKEQGWIDIPVPLQCRPPGHYRD